MRLTAIFKLYKICILLHRCSLKNFAKNRFEKSAIFVKVQPKFCKFEICKNLQDYFAKFQMSITKVDNLIILYIFKNAERAVALQSYLELF